MSEKIQKLTKEQKVKIRLEMKAKGLSDDQINKYLKHVESTGVIVEEKESCEHTFLNKLKDQTFQCTNCQMVIQIVEAMIYRPDGYAEEVHQTLTKMEGIDQWKKKYLRA